MSSVAAALRAARAAGLSSLDAQLLLARILATSRTGLIANDEQMLSVAETRRWDDAVARRVVGEPLAYLLGEKEFAGLMLEVTADVLVPRPETETLVDWAVELLVAMPPGPRSLVDLGTGSGAIALAVQARCRDTMVTATDTSPAALVVARRNAKRHGARIEFLTGSWWEPLGDRTFDVVLSNPPYIAAGDRHLAALRHEPVEALTPGGDGLDALRKIMTGARRHLGHGGWLLVEHGFEQAEAVRAMLDDVGLAAVASRADLAGRPRVSGGRAPAGTR